MRRHPTYEFDIKDSIGKERRRWGLYKAWWRRGGELPGTRSPRRRGDALPRRLTGTGTQADEVGDGSTVDSGLKKKSACFVAWANRAEFRVKEKKEREGRGLPHGEVRERRDVVLGEPGILKADSPARDLRD